MIGLNNIITAFSLYSEEKFTFEQVEVVKSDGTTELTPRLEERTVKAQIPYLNKICGVVIPTDKISENLQKMGFKIINISEEEVEVGVPPYRSDILHPCDIAEDLAISYGFDNI